MRSYITYLFFVFVGLITPFFHAEFVKISFIRSGMILNVPCFISFLIVDCRSGFEMWWILNLFDPLLKCLLFPYKSQLKKNFLSKKHTILFLWKVEVSFFALFSVDLSVLSDSEFESFSDISLFLKMQFKIKKYYSIMISCKCAHNCCWCNPEEVLNQPIVKFIWNWFGFLSKNAFYFKSILLWIWQHRSKLKEK